MDRVYSVCAFVWLDAAININEKKEKETKLSKKIKFNLK